MGETIHSERLRIGGVPAVVYGEPSDRVWLFVHGKCGCKEEGAAFAETVCKKGWQVLATDLPDHGERRGERGFDPMHAVPELRQAAEYIRGGGRRLALRANSIGAWFSMLALQDSPPERSLFVSPITDMERLIRGMMAMESVSEERLRREGEIDTGAGERLSWDYLRYVLNHPIDRWSRETAVLYGDRDNMTSRPVIDAFIKRFGCSLTVMEGGEHWFHTPEQLAVLEKWEDANT